ncbi:helix-turn-helix transcriptional regulator [Microcella daejeonensis]|uniref:Helix-turn-helix transcriptional regulator n=1 Tax=Microcella daejeonensis TaxID=2994971 RepID=A0A9E8MIY6_9MICO|nr:helix-turn-helix transcriptional regulator [Microcella daejeonensis]WAB80403.1 helix-turn-helix transcriptional regulator [Microcella daejeonensis]
MTASDAAALGAFLRSRRDGITPARAGIAAFPSPRRVPGLRKEELAMLAGVSADYYSRIEQGRQTAVSIEVLDALARALRLDETERAHLRDLAAPPSRAGSGGRTAPRQADPSLLRLMTTLDAVPVMLLGERLEVLARNALLEAVLGPLPLGSSLARYVLLDPAARERIVEWERFAQYTVAALRRDIARHPRDARLGALVRQLRESDAQVDAWWRDHGVREFASAQKIIRHPVAGVLHFGIEIVSPPLDPDQRLIVYTAEPGSSTEALLPTIRAWGAEAGDSAPADDPAQPASRAQSMQSAAAGRASSRAGSIASPQRRQTP